MKRVTVAIAMLFAVSCSDPRDEISRSTVTEDNVKDTYNHPKLGDLFLEDVDWQTNEVAVPFRGTPIQVCLAEGNEDGPSPAALSGYDWIESNWQQVRGLIQGQAYEFYSPYADAVTGVPRFEAPEQLWGTEVVLGVRVFSKDDFTVTMRFTWQEKKDPHEITFYIEDGRCETHSVDG